MVKKIDIPTVYKNVYETSVKGYSLLYNTYSDKGFTLYSRKTMKLFHLINGKRNIQNLQNIGLKYGITKKETVKMLNDFYQYNLISYQNTKGSPIFVKEHCNINSYLSLWVYLTENCNYRCTYCFVNKTPKRMSEKTIKLLLKKVIEAGKKYKFKRINLNLAGGEPLLEFDSIRKINEGLKQYNKKRKLFSITLTTNASLLTEKMASYFHKEGILLSISLDGLKEHNDKTRKLPNGKGTFSLTERGLDIAIKYDVLSAILITITNENIKNLLSLVKYALRKNIRLVFQFYKETNRYCKGNRIEYTKDFIQQYKKILRYIYSYYKKYKHNKSPGREHELLDNLYFTGPFRVSNYACSGGIDYFSISTTGIVTNCPSSYCPLSALDDKDPIGKARAINLQKYKHASVENISKCKTCSWKYICAGGCKLERLQVYKSLKKRSEQKCLIYKSLIPYILKLEAKNIVEKFLAGVEK
jgi:uncharacterized protein